MQIFLSYASEDRDKAEQIAFALRERDHEVFLDRDYLLPGRGFNAQIEEDIKQSDLMVFLVSPASIAPGRYTMTELDIARKHWRRAHRRVLPVVLAPVDISVMPNYLKAVSLLQPKGNLVAETAVAVDQLRGLEYALGVAAQMFLISAACGALSWLAYEVDGKATRDIFVPILGRIPAPEVGALFGFPIAIGAWLWGLRRWWVFLTPFVVITCCYWVTAPTISRYTYFVEQDVPGAPMHELIKVKKILAKAEQQVDQSERQVIEAVGKDIVDFNLKYQRSLAGLMVGFVIAFGTMVSLALVLPAFRSVFRWLCVLAVGGIVSSIVTFIVLLGEAGFTRNKAVLLMALWLVVFGPLVGYWLARGKTSVAG